MSPPPPGHGLDALASLAFGHASAAAASASSTTRHLAFLSMEALELDLSDPEQRDFGDYELLEQLGAGGMGVVYRARQKSLDREVAVKLLSAGPWASTDFIERFRREAQSAARLQHPNIVAIHEIGSRDELNYFSMALVRGPNLAQHLADNGPMPPIQAAALVRTIAEALHYAHRLGVLHLDLKPGNVLIDAAGEPQVADFGLARRIDSTLSTDATEVSGTPSYMAPEQVELRRHKLSVATDIYGLGAILYELLTGQPPFDAASPQETLALVLDGRLRNPRRYRSDLPRDLEAICLKCLARDPAERYPSAQALADDLGRFLEGRAVSVRPLAFPQRLARWTRREPRLATAIALGALALLGGLGVALLQRERAEDSAAASRQQTWQTRADAAWRLLSEGRNVSALPLLVDNLREREAHGDDDGVALERLRLGALRQSGAQLIDAIATGGVGRALDISRDGSRVAVADMDEGETVRLYAVDDGRLLWTVATAAHTHFRGSGLPLTRVDFTRDGRHLVSATFEPTSFVVPHGRNNVLIDASNGKVIVPPAEVVPDFYDATYGADGRHALVRDRGGDARLFRVEGWNARSQARRMSGMGGSWIVGDDGRFIGFSISHRLDLLDTGTLQTRFSHRFEPATSPTHWAAQPGGDLLALGHADGMVHLLDTAGLAMRVLRPAPSDPIDTLSFSADGSWLLASAGGRIFLWDAATGQGGPLPSRRLIEARRLQADAATGTVFAFASNDATLWLLPGAAGGDIRPRITAARKAVEQFGFGRSLPRNAGAYAPSARLAASVTRSGELRLWRWRDGDLLQARASALPADELQFDGRHVAAVDGDTVRVVGIPGERDAGPAMVHPRPVSFAGFTPDGRTLVTASGRELRAFDWRTGRARFPPIVLDGSPLRVAISPDSGRLFTTTGAYRDDRYQELGSTFDLHGGQALARDVPLPAPVFGLRFSRNGRHLVHWRYGEVQVRDSASLAASGEPLHFGADMATARNTGRTLRAGSALPGETPVADAAVSNDGTRITLLIHGQEPEKPRLLQVDAGTGHALHSRTLPPGGISRLWPRGETYELNVWSNLSDTMQWIDSGSGGGPMPHAGGTVHHAQAASADGRWLAITSIHGVLLVDRKSHAWATSVLAAHLPLGDNIAQLAFAADGSGLLARTALGHWAWWPLTPETRPLARLQQHVARLHPEPSDGDPIAAALSHEERAELRADDPAIPGPADPAPPVGALRVAPAPAQPPDDGRAPVDLRPAYNTPDASGWNVDLLAWLPPGRQRLLGVDFDIGGMVVLSMPAAPAAAEGFPAASAEVAPPRPRFDALHVLIGGCCPLPGNHEGAYAYLTLHYLDGSRARIPVMHRRDMWFFGEDPGDSARARIAWTMAGPGEFPINFYAPRLANPHPDRDVGTIAFEASEHFASGPLILAATVESASDQPATRQGDR